jgi:hypothetical protein
MPEIGTEADVTFMMESNCYNKASCGVVDFNIIVVPIKVRSRDVTMRKAQGNRTRLKFVHDALHGRPCQCVFKDVD